MKANTSIGNLFAIAISLKSEDGENPEYDRALVEICTEAAGLSIEDKPSIASKLGIDPSKIS